MLAKVIAVDQSESLLGTPSFTFLGLPVPAIAIYREERNRGHAVIQVYAFDGETSTLVNELPEAVGESKHDRYTVLFLIGWTSTDLH